MQTAINENGDHLMLVMWDMYGVEAVVDITERESEELFNMLRTENTTYAKWLNQTVTFMTMRAQVNNQRNYEIYSVWVSSGITSEDIVEMFTTSPQEAADLIRLRGNCVFGSRENKQKQVIF